MEFLNAAPVQGGGMWPTIIMFVLVFAIMYFMMIRPQRKQQKKIETFRNGLQAGQEVVTSGGLYGKIKYPTVTQTQHFQTFPEKKKGQNCYSVPRIINPPRIRLWCSCRCGCSRCKA